MYPLIRFKGPVWVSVWIVASLVISIVNGQEEGSPKEQDIETCSILGVVLANAEAWTKGDVLIRWTDTFDSVKKDKQAGLVGGTFSRMDWRRFVFDFDEGRFLQAKLGTTSGLWLPPEPNLSSKEIASQEWSGVVALKNKQRAWFIENGYRRQSRTVSSEDVEKFLAKSRAFDVRTVWMHPHHGNFFSYRFVFGVFSQRWEHLKAGRGCVSAKKDKDGNLVLIFERITQQQEHFLNTTKIVIDLETQMPIEISVSVRNKETGGFGQGGRATYRWELRDGVFLPTSIRVERPCSVRIERHQQVGHMVQELEFHWFSINSELDPQLFSEDRVKNKAALYRLLDPVATGAKSLIDRDRKQSSGAPDKSDSESDKGRNSKNPS